MVKEIDDHMKSTIQQVRGKPEGLEILEMPEGEKLTVLRKPALIRVEQCETCQRRVECLTKVWSTLPCLVPAKVKDGAIYVNVLGEWRFICHYAHTVKEASKNDVLLDEMARQVHIGTRTFDKFGVNFYWLTEQEDG